MDGIMAGYSLASYLFDNMGKINLDLAAQSVDPAAIMADPLRILGCSDPNKLLVKAFGIDKNATSAATLLNQNLCKLKDDLMSWERWPILRKVERMVRGFPAIFAQVS